MRTQICLQLGSRTGIGQRTTGLQIRQNDGLGRVNDLGRLRHEVDTAKGNHLCVSFRSFITQAQGVAHEVSHFLNFFDLIVVGKNNGIAFTFERKNVFH